ncbi:hypothetical protein V5799_025299 [Amblyomma americanum]|uniref:Uncharacterized protein n=1 Tax=Amblyomma americanum TaxID=6943 RepID=A0AAQ4E9U4_AMBAM
MPVLGFEATASVTTWSNLPVVDIEFETDVPDSVGTCLGSWRCINGSIDYFQVHTFFRVSLLRREETVQYFVGTLPFRAGTRASKSLRTAAVTKA